MMDRIYKILEDHEKWLEELEPDKKTWDAVQHWDIIFKGIHDNLDAHEKYANILNMREGKNLTPMEIEDRAKMHQQHQNGTHAHNNNHATSVGVR